MILTEQLRTNNVSNDMTLVGHSLTGLAIAAAVFPSGMSRRQTAIGLTAYLVLANFPDFGFPWWGHSAYHLSHSLFVGGSLFAVIILLLSIVSACGGPGIPARLIVGGVVAWLSHFLLDSLYGHTIGLSIFWPFSSWRLSLPIPWFTSVGSYRPPITMRKLRVLAIEFACYAPLLGAILATRFALKRKRGDQTSP